jgi:PTH2 family peptidyl-tRNA hydrolase
MKMVIVMRTDLNMRKGKMVGQGGHSVDMSIQAIEEGSNPSYKAALIAWRRADRKKIVVSVSSEEELMRIYGEAIRENLPVSLVIDNGLTEFHGEKTKTCLAIGPAPAEKIDPITGDLKLL